jgi:hypothetical protein
MCFGWYLKGNRARTEFDNFSKFKKIARGKQRYHAGGLTTFPLKCNGNDITEPNNATLNELDAYIEKQRELIKQMKLFYDAKWHFYVAKG